MTPNREPPMKLEMYILERETARNEPFTYQEKDELKLIWEAQEARIARMLALLKKLEWHMDDGAKFCPICYGHYRHGESCTLKAELESSK